MGTTAKRPYPGGKYSNTFSAPRSTGINLWWDCMGAEICYVVITIRSASGASGLSTSFQGRSRTHGSGLLIFCHGGKGEGIGLQTSVNSFTSATRILIQRLITAAIIFLRLHHSGGCWMPWVLLWGFAH